MAVAAFSVSSWVPWPMFVSSKPMSLMVFLICVAQT